MNQGLAGADPPTEASSTSLDSDASYDGSTRARNLGRGSLSPMTVPGSSWIEESSLRASPRSIGETVSMQSATARAGLERGRGFTSRFGVADRPDRPITGRALVFFFAIGVEVRLTAGRQSVATHRGRAQENRAGVRRLGAGYRA
jgi:hypothetical protein